MGSRSASTPPTAFTSTDSPTIRRTQNIALLADPVVPNLELTQFLGVNDNNMAVGYYQTNDGSQHGFLYDLNTHAYTFVDDPNAAKSGFSITQITGINDANEIAGFYVDAATGLQRGFVATAARDPPRLSSLLPRPVLALLVYRWCRP